MLICAFGALIKEPLLSDYEWLNVHPSLLPRWRGAAPVERAIDGGDQRTGVSIMRPTAEMDAGPVCLQREEPIAADDTYGTLAPRLARLGGDLLVEALETRPPFEEQPDDGVTFADKITPDDRRLDPARTPAELECRVRALSPHIGAWLERPDGERMGVLRARAASDEVEPGRLRARGRTAALRMRGRCARATRGQATRRSRDGRGVLAARPCGEPGLMVKLAHSRRRSSRQEPTPARACAFRVLQRTFGEGAYADRAFRAEADRAGLDARDRAFAQRLAYGAIQNRRTLDYVIIALSSRGDRLDRPAGPQRAAPRHLPGGAARRRAGLRRRRADR